MTEFVSFLQDHKAAFWWIALGSAAIFVGSLMLVPWLVTRIPADYFLSQHRPTLPFANRHPLLRGLGLVAKNLVGFILVVAGLAMLFLPGQGLLTIVIGMLLVDFPGKHRLEGNIIRRRPIARSVNWLRQKRGVEPLNLEPLDLEPRPEKDHE